MLRPGGRYRLTAQVGWDDLGEVWQAFDELLGRQVDVVLLGTDKAGEQAMFRDAAQTMGRDRPALIEYGEMTTNGLWTGFRVEEARPGDRLAPWPDLDDPEVRKHTIVCFGAPPPSTRETKRAD